MLEQYRPQRGITYKRTLVSLGNLKSRCYKLSTFSRRHYLKQPLLKTSGHKDFMTKIKLKNHLWHSSANNLKTSKNKHFAQNWEEQGSLRKSIFCPHILLSGHITVPIVALYSQLSFRVSEFQSRPFSSSVLAAITCVTLDNVFSTSARMDQISDD